MTESLITKAGENRERVEAALSTLLLDGSNRKQVSVAITPFFVQCREKYLVAVLVAFETLEKKRIARAFEVLKEKNYALVATIEVLRREFASNGFLPGKGFVAIIIEAAARQNKVLVV